MPSAVVEVNDRLTLNLQEISPELRALLMDLKNMSPVQRFAVASTPRCELNWMTVAYLYGMEKLEAQKWIIPDSEFDPPIPPEADAVPPAESALPSDHSVTGPPDDPLTPDAAQEQAAQEQNDDQSVLDEDEYDEEDEQEDENDEDDEDEEEDDEEEDDEDEEEDDDDEEDGEDDDDEDDDDDLPLQVRAQRRRERVEREDAEAMRQAIELNHAEADKKRQEYVVEPIPADAVLGNLPQFDPDYVLADNGFVTHVVTVQHELEKKLREELGVPQRPFIREEQIAFYKRQLRLLEKADQAPRCAHVYMDGTTCRAPRLKEGRLCYAHERMNRVRPKKLRLLPPEDANSVVMNLMEISRALVDDQISERKAGLLMYQQQLGLVALKQVTFKETDPAEMLTEMPPAERDHRRRRAQPAAPVADAECAPSECAP